MMHWKRGRSGPAIGRDLDTDDLCWIFYNVSTPRPASSALTFLEKAADIAASRKIAANRKPPKNNDDNMVYLSATENRVKMNAGRRLTMFTQSK